ncbi:hypothetical protein CRG98_001365 [Punica granatum]|nr:hypothetical protein CRG98_001365 [Punica granatum]
MEKRAHDDVSNGDDHLEELLPTVENRSPMRKENDQLKTSSPHRQLTISKIENSPSEPNPSLSPSRGIEQDDQIESARAEMGEMREENERLKMYLERIMRDYKELQMQFFNIVKQEDGRQQQAVNPGSGAHQELEESDLVSLNLGWVSGSSSVGKDKKRKLSALEIKDQKINDDQQGLALSLDCNFEAAKSGTVESLAKNMNPEKENSSEDPKEDAGEMWPPSKVLKTMRSGEDEVSQQNPAKKTRVCVRARCNTPTMNDGCQWRKYGQKIAKGNPCPRAYYRCTVAPSCPVRKQVQRCAEDMSILITTYEGTHNHPLPVSATAMASTTSAAASMLLSGSLTSESSQAGSQPIAAATDLHGLNFYLSDPSRSKQFYLPNSSLMTPSPSHPTITLDLTSGPPVSSSASSYLNRFFSATSRSNSSTSLNFHSSEPCALPIPWGNGLLNYGTTSHQPFNKSDPQESFLHHLPSLQKTNNNPQDSIAAAAKAITTEPNFQSALAAALKSIIGVAGSAAGGTTLALGNYQGGSGVDIFSQKSSWNESFWPRAEISMDQRHK